MSNLVDRQAAINHWRSIIDATDGGGRYDMGFVDGLEFCISDLSTMPSAQPEIIRCKDCKHFELDHFEKVEGFPVPIIVAHEICMKWSDGCRTSKDGWCFMGERRTDG